MKVNSSNKEELFVWTDVDAIDDLQWTRFYLSISATLRYLALYLKPETNSQHHYLLKPHVIQKALLWLMRPHKVLLN